MSQATKIEWTDVTWNPIRARSREAPGWIGTHCVKISAGCANCYAERHNARMLPGGGTGLGYVASSTARVETIFDEGKLAAPLGWKRPRRVFVCSLSDLFGEWVSDQQIDRVFAAMATAERHTYQVLTKRPGRMRAWFERVAGLGLGLDGKATERGCKMFGDREVAWPLPNVWLGVSVEDQRAADERIPLLLHTPAAVRFVSAEPLLAPIDFARVKTGCGEWATGCCCSAPKCGHTKLDWVIVGGESGPGARPCDVDWIRRIVEQCKEARVACFVKQLGHAVEARNDQIADVWPDNTETTASASYQGAPLRVLLRHSKGGDPAEWPEDLRVREFPTLR
ncbi:MAG: phage Gp37/Gp68 family protein [Planctomycetes bacterium]|nr:phage Gp37/Gp68 family protein [Planctomycetota bacterium]